MTVNLLKKIHEKIDDRLVGQIGTVLGENEDRTRAGIQAAVPTLLRGVMGVASTEQGTQMVERELDPFDDGIIHEYGKQLEFEKSRQLIDDGSDLVQAFFGNATVRTLGIVSRESGLGATKCRSLTGILMPLVLGVAGERRKEKNLDTIGFQHLLAGQNDYIARKVPDGVCAALNLPKLEKRPFYPPQSTKPTLAPYHPSVTTGAGLTAASSTASSNIDSVNQTLPSSAASLSATHSTAAADSAYASSTSSATKPSSSPQGAAVSSSSNGVLSDDGYYEGGLGWVWSLVLPLILLLGLLGWFFSRADTSDAANDSETSQVTNVEQVNELPSWEESSPPLEFDTNKLLNEDIPSIAPPIEDFDEDESTALEENAAVLEGVDSAEVIDSPDASNNPKAVADEDTNSDQTINGEFQDVGNDTTLSRESPPDVVLANVASGQSIATASPSPLALSTEPTVATAINRRNPPTPNQVVRFAPAGKLATDNSSATSANAIAPKNSFNESPNNDSHNALAKRFSRITDRVTHALQRIDNAEDARRASKTVSRLSNDLYDLTPAFRGIDKELRRELNQHTNAFATSIENLYDHQIDAVGEKEILLPSLIVLMQRIEATLNS